ncbi:hypothetical protein [Sphingopyxis panaciterrae]
MFVTRPDPRPAAVFHKGLAIFNSIHAGANSVAAIGDATGFPATTIIRVLSLLVHEDDIVEAQMEHGALRLSVKSRGLPEDLA